MRERCCLYCGLYGHFRSACRAFGKRPVTCRQGRTVTGVSRTVSPSNSGLFLPITLIWGDQKHQLRALIDSGAAGNFIDISLAKSLQIHNNSLPAPLTAIALDGTPLAPGKITHLTSLLCLVTYQHQEIICFHLIQSPEFPVILGHPCTIHTLTGPLALSSVGVPPVRLHAWP